MTYGRPFVIKVCHKAILSHNLLNGTDVVPLNAPIRLQFNERLGARCVTSNTVQLSEGGSLVSGSTSLSDDRQFITFRPDVNLIPSTDYSLNLNGVCDQSTQYLLPYSLDFTTGTSVDLTAPVVTNTMPANGATNVPLDSNIVIEFDELIDEQAFMDQVDSLIVISTGGSWSVSGDTATFTPNQLFSGAEINLTLTDIKDRVGNSSGSYVYSFFTETGGDDVPPPK